MIPPKTLCLEEKITSLYQITDYLEIGTNKSKTYLVDADKVIFGGKFRALTAFIGK